MTNFILLGGNGYLGSNFIQYGMQHDPNAHFYVVSRSGKLRTQSPAVTAIQADVHDSDLESKLPESIDYIVDFIGAPEKDPKKSTALNIQPAMIMKKIAEHNHVKAMGFVGGILGDKSFVQTKKNIINQLSQSSVRLAYVEPTLVYGNGRQDSMTKMVPLLKFLGIFSKKFRPVKVDDVVAELWQKLVNENATK